MKSAHHILMAFIVTLLVVMQASAMMNIHTRDGRVIQVPVNKSDVVRITYDDVGGIPHAKGHPWVVNSNGNIYSRASGNWQQLPGLAKDIGVGADGSVWVIGMDPEPGGYGIHHWNGNGWNKIEGSAMRIAVDPSGAPWVVNVNGNIYSRASGSWQLMPGLAKDIGIGADGSVWVIGTDPTPGGYGIYRWNGSDWSRIDGGATDISVR